MRLTNLELSRAAALIDGLRLLNENNAPEQLDEKQLAALQTFTVEKGTRYAEAYGVDFPDETLPESLLLTLSRSKGRPSVEEMARLAALAPSYSRAFVDPNDTEPDWTESVDDSAAYAA